MSAMNKYNYKFFFTNWNSSFYMSIIVIICLVPIILSIFFAPISPDSAYYLTIAERISEGLTPYTDIKVGYTPLVLYLSVLLKKIFLLSNNYEFFLTSQLILQLICAYLVYKITDFFIARKDLSFLAGALFVLAAHWNDGNYYLLEIPTLFFGLLAIYITLKQAKNNYIYLLIGFLLALAFLSKQYGLGFLILVIYLIQFGDKKGVKIINLGIGFALPILFCFWYWGLDFYNVIFIEYGKTRTVFESIETIASRTLYLAVRMPILIAAFYYVPSIFKKADINTKKGLGLAIYAILGFLLQFYFAKYAHYYLLILPFVSILTFIILAKNTTKITSLVVSLTFVLSIYATYHDQVYKVYIKQNSLRSDQYKLANEILKNTCPNKTLYISDIGLISQYYLTNMLPPNLNSIGYTFGMALNNETHLTQIKSASYILKYANENNNYGLNTKSAKLLLNTKKKITINNVNLYH